MFILLCEFYGCKIFVGNKLAGRERRRFDQYRLPNLAQGEREYVNIMKNKLFANKIVRYTLRISYE